MAGLSDLAKLYSGPQVDPNSLAALGSQFNQPFGELSASPRPSPTQWLGNKTQDLMESAGASPYVARHLTEGLSGILGFTPLGLLGSAANAVDANARNDNAGTLQAMAGMIPGVGPIERKVAAEAGPMIRASGDRMIKTDDGLKINVRPDGMEIPEWGKGLDWGATAYRGKRGGQDAIYIRDVRLPEEAQGQGHGTAMYEGLASQAAEEGLPFQSDSTVTHSAARAWASLKRRGYDVQTAPQDKLLKFDGPSEAPELGRHETKDGSPVFWIAPPK